MITEKTGIGLLVLMLAGALCIPGIFARDDNRHDSGRPECFMVMAGKGATTDGSVLLAHNNDLTGTEASLIRRYPRRRYGKDDRISFSSGLKIPRASETFAWMALQIEKGFAEGDAIAINEFGVSIAGGVALGGDRNKMAELADPLVKNGLTGGVRYIALQRSRSARRCVEILGALYSRFGVTYPSGVGIADTNEVWYIECGGGRSWAAVRIPDSCYSVHANGYRIGSVDPADTSNYILSEGLLEFCREKGLWNPGNGPFSFKKAFGGMTAAGREKRFYNTRRVWRGLDLLSPSLELDPESKEYPLYAIPDKKIAIEDLFSLLRDTYEGTRYFKYGSEGAGERAIACQKGVHTDVVQLRTGMPAEIGAVMWAGMSMPQATAYVPFYLGITDVPRAYATAAAEDTAAFHRSRTIGLFVIGDYGKSKELIMPRWQRLESRFIRLQPEIESAALSIFGKDPVSARDILTAYVIESARLATDEAERIIAEINSGNVSE